MPAPVFVFLNPLRFRLGVSWTKRKCWLLLFWGVTVVIGGCSSFDSSKVHSDYVWFLVVCIGVFGSVLGLIWNNCHCLWFFYSALILFNGFDNVWSRF